MEVALKVDRVIVKGILEGLVVYYNKVGGIAARLVCTLRMECLQQGRKLNGSKR